MILKNTSTCALVATLGLIYTGFLASAQAADFAAPLTLNYERPGVDWSQYDKLIIDDIDVSDTRIIPPPWTEDKPFKWQASESNVEALQREYHASMSEQISGNDGYEIVTEPGKGVVEISLEIVSFMPYAQRDEDVVTKGSGEMHINVIVRDAMTGQSLAIYEGPQEVGQDYNQNTDFSRQKNLKMLFASWGKRLRVAMDRDRH